MHREAFKKQEPCCKKQQLDAEIRELMMSLQKQNDLLSECYEKLTNKSLQEIQKRLRMETDHF